MVPTAQYLGRLVTHMLEPETDDNVVYWNTMDAWIPRPGDGAEAGGGRGSGRGGGNPPGGRGRRGGGARGGQASPSVVPIYKLMTPVALSSMVIDEAR